MPSLKIISPDGSFIKKNQIQELRNLFSKSSQITDKRVYVIDECEKMNKEAANTLLKFLEEPTGNVIGFFITNHIDNVIPTVQSRCQQLKANFNNELYEELNIEKDKFNEYEKVISSYINAIENKSNKSIIINKECLSEYEKEDIVNIFKIMLSIYQRYYQNNYNICYNNHDEELDCSIISDNSSEKLKKKINLIIKLLGYLNYNVNVDLLLDRFVLEMDGINNESI